MKLAVQKKISSKAYSKRMLAHTWVDDLAPAPLLGILRAASRHGLSRYVVTFKDQSHQERARMI
jgi:hypothetical protein